MSWIKDLEWSKWHKRFDRNTFCGVRIFETQIVERDADGVREEDKCKRCLRISNMYK